MTVRFEVEFVQPLDHPGGISLLLAAASLPEVRRVVISPDRRRCAVYAADLPPGRLAEAIGDAGLAPGRILSGLAPEAAACLEAPVGERLRPIGR